MNFGRENDRALYESIAPRYNYARPLEGRDKIFWTDLVFRSIPGKHVFLLDVGCGNGRWAIPFAQNLKYQVTGVDNSPGMLRLSQNNDSDHRVQWCLQDAARLAFPDNSFDAIWISQLLHLVANPVAVLQESYRVLRPKGKIIIRYTTLEDNIKKPERCFFPGLTEIDKKRIPSQNQVLNWFQSTNYSHVSSDHVMIQVYENAMDRFNKARLRVESGLTKLTDVEFEIGIKKFKDYILDHPSDRWILEDNYTITTGIK